MPSTVYFRGEEMINELERLLSNAYSPYDNVFYSAIVVMKDKMTFGGVSIKNNI